MPKLMEYEGKRLLKDCNILVPKGAVASTSKEAYKIAKEALGKIASVADIEVCPFAQRLILLPMAGYSQIC